jgi:hypothetical protein
MESIKYMKRYSEEDSPSPGFKVEKFCSVQKIIAGECINKQY